MNKKATLAIIILVFSGILLKAQGTIHVTNKKGREKIILPGKNIAYSLRSNRFWMGKGKFIKAENNEITISRFGKYKVLKVNEIKFIGYRTIDSVFLSVLSHSYMRTLPFSSGVTFRVIRVEQPYGQLEIK
ncbi:MAG: hypothetical protein M3Q58_05400 [Bacteroidota bacterium]|nr:hypothetical protein [Bacteroidota bacterium]